MSLKHTWFLDFSFFLIHLGKKEEKGDKEEKQRKKLKNNPPQWSAWSPAFKTFHEKKFVLLASYIKTKKKKKQSLCSKMVPVMFQDWNYCYIKFYVAFFLILATALYTAEKFNGQHCILFYKMIWLSCNNYILFLSKVFLKAQRHSPVFNFTLLVNPTPFKSFIIS